MRKLVNLQLVILLIVGSLYSCTNTIPKKSEIDVKVSELLSQMTLEEKVGQMTQISINLLLDGDSLYAPYQPFALQMDSVRKAIKDYNVGSIFGCSRSPFTREQWHSLVGGIQNVAINETRLAIPIIYGVDAVHGTTFTKEGTLFPQQITQAATWNTELVKKGAQICAYEAKASSAHWNFSPVLGLGRQPLWSRFFETFGEDVYLTTVMGQAMIKGYEGNDVSDPYSIAACMKHYIGYSIPISGKDRTQTWIPERQMREYFLPPFKKAVQIGVHSMMINSGEINGMPVHCSKYLLTDLLRDELGFEGVAVTDFKDIILLHKSHKVAATYKEAIKLAINAGVDMSMVPMEFEFSKLLVELVNEGQVPLSRINESVSRILKLKYQLGLFEQSMVDFNNYPEFGSVKHQQVSKEMAQEAITLLKNKNDLLPLNKSTKILVTGPTSNSMIYLNGPWSYTWQGNDAKYDPIEKNTVFEAIKKISKSKVTWIQGTSITEEININESVKNAIKTDVIVVCVGETPGVEEIGNTNSLDLEKIQLELVKRLALTGKPIVLVINSGRPRIISEIEPLVDAVIMAYYPANEGGDALAEILFGDINPSGKLPFTYPKYSGSISQYDHKNSDNNISGEIKPYNPQYEFGFGKSYTNFKYSNLRLSNTKFKSDDTIVIKVDLTNIGKREGKEVVQLYISDDYASITPAVKRLRGFQKLNLEVNETKTLSFTVSIKDLAFVGIDNTWITEAGTFTIQIGGLSQEFILE